MLKHYNRNLFKGAEKMSHDIEIDFTSAHVNLPSHAINHITSSMDVI